MHVLAATDDPWGISGPTFLGLYAALAVVAVIATMLTRRALARSPAPAPHLDNPDNIAYLHNGPELTVLTTLSAMHAAGCITSSGRGRVQAIGAVGPDTGELERAIHLSTQQPVPRAKIPGTPPVAEALGRIERRLIDIGLLLGAEQRKRIRRTGWMLWAVVAVGAIRAVVGYLAGKPIGFLLALLAVVAVGAAVFSRTAPQRTDRGDAELARLRAAYASLSPRLRPDSRVYGPAGAALGVAVFGASALSAADPTLAEELDVRPTSSAGYSGGGDGGGGCGGGGGGGGCGG
ncbi:MAG: TIGR04222 domain-containing membrane protein, partial [Pseudonocardiaceae bacterium]